MASDLHAAGIMPSFLVLETPLWEIVLRGSAVYVGLAAVIRLIPKRHTGNVSPNDLIALIIVGTLAADAIVGDAKTMTDVFLMAVVILVWDYLFNLFEFRFPRFRKIAQDSPTLLVHDGTVLKKNLDKEKLTEEELAANLRRQGVEDVSRVRLAILEAEGHISVIRKDPQPTQGAG